MEINGREINLMMTVGASASIADLCPDGDLYRLHEVLDGHQGTAVRATAKIIVALNKGYCDNHEGENPLTLDEVMALDMNTFKGLASELATTIKADSEPQMDVEPKKNEEPKKADH